MVSWMIRRHLKKKITLFFSQNTFPHKITTNLMTIVLIYFKISVISRLFSGILAIKGSSTAVDLTQVQTKMYQIEKYKYIYRYINDKWASSWNSRLNGSVSQSQLKPNLICSMCSTMDTMQELFLAAVVKVNIDVCDSSIREPCTKWTTQMESKWGPRRVSARIRLMRQIEAWMKWMAESSGFVRVFSTCLPFCFE